MWCIPGTNRSVPTIVAVNDAGASERIIECGIFFPLTKPRC